MALLAMDRLRNPCRYEDSASYMSSSKRIKKRKMNKERGRERDLVDSSADELAAENNVTKQDGEIAA